MNELKGAFILARKIIESDIFLNKPDKWFKIWIFIISYVNFKKNNQFERGENFFTYALINQNTRATKDQIDKFIRWSKNCKMLATRKTTRGMTIKVLKYDKYQEMENYKSDTKSDIKAKQKRHKSDTIIEECKNEKNILQTEVCGDFNSDEYIAKLVNDKQRHIQLIGKYASTLKMKFPSQKAISAFIKQHVKYATELAEYPDEEIRKTVEYIIEQKWLNKWTLSTILKYINKIDE